MTVVWYILILIFFLKTDALLSDLLRLQVLKGILGNSGGSGGGLLSRLGQSSNGAQSASVVSSSSAGSYMENYYKLQYCRETPFRFIRKCTTSSQCSPYLECFENVCCATNPLSLRIVGKCQHIFTVKYFLYFNNWQLQLKCTWGEILIKYWIWI